MPQSVFAELLSLAAIPHTAYAVDEEVPGAMCLVKADGGFEVFSRTDDARLDVRFFEDEEAAYFYLFGVLAAEAVRSGRQSEAGPGIGEEQAMSAASMTSTSSEWISGLRARKTLQIRTISTIGGASRADSDWTGTPAFAMLSRFRATPISRKTGSR